MWPSLFITVAYCSIEAHYFIIYIMQKCHHTGNYDATKCYEDCKTAETGEFAKNCTAEGGLFKCCIR